jgi:hypothetical protein
VQFAGGAQHAEAGTALQEDVDDLQVAVAVAAIRFTRITGLSSTTKAFRAGMCG